MHILWDSKRTWKMAGNWIYIQIFQHKCMMRTGILVRGGPQRDFHFPAPLHTWHPGYWSSSSPHSSGFDHAELNKSTENPTVVTGSVDYLSPLSRRAGGRCLVFVWGETALPLGHSPIGLPTPPHPLPTHLPDLHGRQDNISLSTLLMTPTPDLRALLSLLLRSAEAYLLTAAVCLPWSGSNHRHLDYSRDQVQKARQAWRGFEARGFVRGCEKSKEGYYPQHTWLSNC